MEMKIHGTKKMKSKHRSARNTDLVSVIDPNISFGYAEAYKTLRTNLDFIANKSQGKGMSIVVTSARPAESKSTVSINLAMSIADSQKSVILVECDLRRPTVRRYLRLERRDHGLSSVLAGNAELDDCIQVVEGKGISVLPAGTIPPNPSELLNRPVMKEIIEKLTERYNYVILDAPPVNVMTDAAVVGQMADGALLVVRSRYTATKLVRQALQRLKNVNINVLGVVLTRFKPSKSAAKYDYDYEGYGYSSRQPRSDV